MYGKPSSAPAAFSPTLRRRMKPICVVRISTLLASGSLLVVNAADRPALNPVVEVEEEVYAFAPANNGAGPMWCSGSTCLVRTGDRIWASGLETLDAAQAKPLNNCRWKLLVRSDAAWNAVTTDPDGRTREPSPLATFADGTLFLSAN